MVFRQVCAPASLLLPLAALTLTTGCPWLPGPRPSGGTTGPEASENPEIKAGRHFLAAAPMPAPRMGFAYAAYKGRIYVFGGLTRPSWDSATNSIDVYDPLSDTWSLDGSLRYAMSFASAAVLGDKIYLAGGQVPKSGGCPPEDVDEILAYDPADHTIDQVGKLGEPRWGLALLPFESGLIAAGGSRGPLMVSPSRVLFGSPAFGSGCSAAMPQLTRTTTFITSDATSSFIPLAQGRAHAGAGTLGGTPFLTQGWVQNPDHPSIANQATSLDRPNKQWTGSVPPNMDTTWGVASAQASRDAFVVVGGLHPGYGSDSNVPAGQPEVRLISASPNRSLEGSSRLLPALPQGLGLAGAAVLNDKLFVFGGLSGSPGREVVNAGMWVLRDMSAEAAEQQFGNNVLAPTFTEQQTFR